MIKLKFTTKGLDKAINFESGNFFAAMADAMSEAGKESIELYRDRLGRYPQENSGSKYVRTFHLRDGWMSANPVTFFVGGPFSAMIKLTNPVSYTSLVQGDDNGAQAKMHVGNWLTAKALAEDTGLAEVAVGIYSEKIQGKIDQVLK